MDRPFVSVIIPTYNESKNVDALIAALERQSYGTGNFEAIFADNGSDDGTFERLCALKQKWLQVVTERDIRGADAARNRALPFALGEILAFTDADCRPDPDWIEMGVQSLQHGDHSLTAGRVEFTFSELPSLSQLYDSMNFLQQDISVKKRRIAFTCNLFVRARVFEKIPSFPVLPGLNGDSVFTAKATDLGFDLIYAESVRVSHPARDFSSLMKKIRRVSEGQGAMPRYEKPYGLRVLASRPHLLNLNPWHLRQRLLFRNISLSKLRFLQLWIFGFAMIALAISSGIKGSWQKA